jgi:hypothetical protein
MPAPHTAPRRAEVPKSCAFPAAATASASEIINAQQRYLGSQEPRRVRGSTVAHRRHQRGAALTRLLQRSVSTQIDARQRLQASPSMSAGRRTFQSHDRMFQRLKLFHVAACDKMLGPAFVTLARRQQLAGLNAVCWVPARGNEPAARRLTRRSRRRPRRRTRPPRPTP